MKKTLFRICALVFYTTVAKTIVLFWLLTKSKHKFYELENIVEVLKSDSPIKTLSQPLNPHTITPLLHLSHSLFHVHAHTHTPKHI